MKRLFSVFLGFCILCGLPHVTLANTLQVVDLNTIPAYSSHAYVPVDNNIPSFSDEELSTVSTKTFSSLDSSGRCQKAFAVIGKDLMPTKKRDSIGMIRPSGWHLVKYDGIDGKYLYNRCHLIGYQLCGENANRLNLITGTRYLNVEGMLPFENMVADYVKETGHHVAYRATPVFEGANELASGVQIEARSIEDNGEGIEFNVYCYNVQPGIQIDYATGDSSKLNTTEPKRADNEMPAQSQDTTANYIININTGVFHRPDCRSVALMAEHNKDYETGTREDIIQRGYRPCQNCNP